MKARSNVMYYGGRLKGEWWKPRRWKVLQESLEDPLVSLLEPRRILVLAVDEQISAVEARMASMRNHPLPRGMGTIVYQRMERKVGDWNRFENRRQIGSCTGLCPSEDTSANRRFQGSINKQGKPRLGHMLIECTWLLMQ